jgi:hypothetical protein
VRRIAIGPLWAEISRVVVARVSTGRRDFYLEAAAINLYQFVLKMAKAGRTLSSRFKPPE